MPKYLTSFIHGRNVPDREHKRSQLTSLRGPIRRQHDFLTFMTKSNIEAHKIIDFIKETRFYKQL